MELTVDLMMTFDEFSSCVNFSKKQKKELRELISMADAWLVIEDDEHVLLNTYVSAMPIHLEILHDEALEDPTYKNFLRYDGTCRMVLRQLLPALRIVLRRHIEDPYLNMDNEFKTELFELASGMKQIIKHFLAAQDLLLDWIKLDLEIECASGPEAYKSEE